MFRLEGKRVLLAGHNGMVGRAVVPLLEKKNCEIITANRSELNLIHQDSVSNWLSSEKPDVVVVCAAKVGGILANQTQPADFIYQNLMIQTNLIHGAFRVGVEKLLFLGSSCIYPKYAQQPLKEKDLLTGSLEPTNQWYAIAKIAGIKLCEAYRKQHGYDFISAMPTNLYGPFDNFDLNTSHVVPALIRKVVEAKECGAQSLEIWGSGKAEREFMHVEDCAQALVFLLENYSEDEHVNVGTGSVITIEECAELICEINQFSGRLRYDISRPDGTPTKCLDTSKLRQLGWHPSIKLIDGLRSTSSWFKNNRAKVKQG